MPEIKTEVKTYLKEYICDDCINGNVYPTGMVYDSYPAQYPHECETCKKQYVFLECYPVTVVEK